MTGALAELEIGPIARNISGARQAAARIVSSLYCDYIKSWSFLGIVLEILDFLPF